MIVILMLSALLQSSTQSTGPYRIESFTSGNGLPQNTVASLAQTPDGFLWIGTYDGLARYDGVRFTVFDRANTPAIKGTQFLSLFVDSRGTLWAGTSDGGLVRYRDGEFKTYTTADGLAQNYVGRIQESPRGLLLFYGDGVPPGQWSESRGATVADARALSEFASPAGVRWVRRERDVLRVVRGDTTAYPLAIQPQEFGRFRWAGPDSTLWIGTFGRGIYHLARGRVRHYGPGEGMPATDRIKVAGIDRSGRIWIQSESELLRLEGERFVPLGLKRATFGVRAALVDGEGTVWVGMNTDGLLRVTRRVITTYGEAEGLPERIVYPVMSEPDGSVLVASGPRLSRFERGRFQPFLAVDRPRSLHRAADGRLWIGTSVGLIEQRGTSRVDHSERVERSAIDVVLRTRDGALWAGGIAGLFRLTGDSTRRFNEADGLPGGSVSALHEDREGRLWIGSSGGLARFERGRLVTDSLTRRLAGARVRAFYQDTGGALWIGTAQNGLFRLAGTRVTNFTSNTGLAHNGVFAILEDRRGSLWLSSNRGISRVSRLQLEEVAAGRRARVNAIAYGQADGMRTAECNGGRQPAAAQTPDGHLWFPTLDGVVEIDPERAYSNAPPPPVSVEAVTVDGIERSWRSPLRIEPGERDLEITYTAPSFHKTDGVQYRYRLGGSSEEWIYAGNRRSVNYSHLAPGRYTFQVEASNSDGEWHSAGDSGVATLELTVIPYFWQTGWFAALVVVAAVALALAGAALRIRQLRAAERRLTRLVAERTAELAAANRTLEQLATSDALTGLANRRRFDAFLHDEWRRAERSGLPITLLVLDVDFFKRFNDTYGHQAGDDCLRSVASVIAQAAQRPTDLAARYGGEEFAVVLGNTDLELARARAESIRAAVQQLAIPHSRSDASETVTVSIGVATARAAPFTSPSDLVAAADRALYTAKENGRNQVAADLTLGVPAS